MDEITTLVVLVTEVVAMGKDAEIAPAGTATVAGTLTTEGLELVSVTLAPVEGAGLPRFTVFAVLDAPPVTVLGLRMTEDKRCTHGRAAPAPPDS